jgi:hypothetical protein
MPFITDLPELIARLGPEQRARFERIFDVELVPGGCVIPPTMREWATKTFGNQKILLDKAIRQSTHC